MRILMLGNSFTFYHDMPKILAQMLDAEVTAHTRGGARLAEQLNPETEMGAKTLAALKNEKWDYVVLQEQSNAPIFTKKSFHASVEKLTKLIRGAGAVPVLYATWAYRENTEKLSSTNLSYDEMDEGLFDSYHEAAEQNGTLIADVGKAFTAMRSVVNLYEDDDYHPSEAGSTLAAATIAQAITKDVFKKV